MFTFQQWLNDFFAKAAGHKYIKRIPYQSGGKLRYRYIYNVTHTHQGKHILDPDHMKVGTKLMLDATSGKEVHGHITDVRGDLVSFQYDDGPLKGEVVTMGKERLAAELDKVHGISGKLSAAREKQKAVVDKLKERGASEKQIAREQKRLDALGVDDTPLRMDARQAEDGDVASAPAPKRLLSSREAVAEHLKDVLEANDLRARVWQRDDMIRVYVSQRLRRGWDDMGYYFVKQDGTLGGQFVKRPAGMRQLGERAMRDVSLDI